MNKQSLKNIFEDRSTKTVYGTITKRISSKRFKVEDDAGRDIIVDSDTDWGVGTKVIIQNNFIVGTGSLSGTFEVFTV